MTSTPSSTLARAAAHLRLDGISIAFAGRRVLTDVSFTVPAGDRTGLIGENGTGKTTLLRIIAGLTRPDTGNVSVTAPGGRAPRIGLLHQEPPFPAKRWNRRSPRSARPPMRSTQRPVPWLQHPMT